MPKCYNCGAKVGFLAAYCTDCKVERKRKSVGLFTRPPVPKGQEQPPQPTECRFCRGQLEPRAKKCQHCGEWVSRPPASISVATVIGALLLVGGSVGAVWAITLDASVDGVNNIGLLLDKQNLLFVAGIQAVIGTLLILYGSRSRR